MSPGAPPSGPGASVAPAATGAAGTLSSRTRIVTGSVAAGMARFGTPLAIGMGLQTTFNLVDAYVISRLEPEVAGPALGAVGICDQLTAIGTIVSYGLTTASAALIAQAHGRRNQPAVSRLVWQSLLAVAALSIVFGVAATAFAEPILRKVVGAKGMVVELGAPYLRIMGGGSFSIFFLLQLTAIQRALGSSKTPAALLVASNVLNLFLAVLLVYGPGPAPPALSWGPPIARALHLPRLELLGAAWATLLARTLILVPVVLLLVRRFDVLSHLRRRAPDLVTLRRLAHLAWPSSAQLVVRILAMLVTHSLVARAFTTPEDQSATTALGIVFRLETLALFVSMGWGSAAQTFVGQNLGAGQPARAVRSGWIAALYDAVLLVAIAVGYDWAARPIVSFFDADPEVVAIAVGYVGVVAWSYLGLGTGVVLGSAITGAGATRTTLLVDLGVVVAIQLPASMLAVLLPDATPERLWIAVAATYAASGIAYAIVFRFVPWLDAASGTLDDAGTEAEA